MTQFFRGIKRDVNDDLYSKIIRFGITRCARCFNVRDLQCAHIMSRTHKTTRHLLFPVRNAVPLCADCHSWFDQHKMFVLIFEEDKRVFKGRDESFSFLVESCGYTWNDLQKLYINARNTMTYNHHKKEITEQLKQELKRLQSL